MSEGHVSPARNPAPMGQGEAWPEYVTFYPGMGIEAARRSSGMGGGWRLHVFGKALDGQGRGWVYRDELRAFVLSLGVNRMTWRRWLDEARKYDLVSDVQDSQERGGRWRLILPGAGHAALAMGCEYVGNRKAIMRATDLVGIGWRARVFSAWGNGSTISRERLQKTTNVPVRTQRHRDAQAGTIRAVNVAELENDPSELEGMKEFSHHKGLYVADDKVMSRKPNTRHSQTAERGATGRARKANAIIRKAQPSGLFQGQQAMGEAAQNSRIFCLTEAQREAAERKLSRSDRRVYELYQPSHVLRGAQVWKQYPVRG